MQHHDHAQQGASRNVGSMRPYWLLGLSLGLGLVSMYVLMYLMVDRLEHVELNVGTLWMALAMVAPMGAVMLLTMPSMYPDKRLNAGLIVAFVALLGASVWLDRTQALVGDDQFLRAMIPHHSGAIFMCREAQLTDPQIVDLCEQITQSQESEIRTMEDILAGE